MLINQIINFINKPIVLLFIVILFCIGYFLYTSLVGDIQTNFFLFGPVKDENDNYLPNMISNETHVKYFPPTPNVEEYIHKCDETASILLGRTTIEGWMCGKKGWIYDVDSYGKILSKKLHDIPNDMDKFKSDNVAKKIMEQYISVLD